MNLFLLSYTAFLSSAWFNPSKSEPDKSSPNIIYIFCDDVGYGDIGCYGSTIHKTPNVDKLAKQGLRFTDFYAGSSVCTPSRASLLTGCYPQRIDMHVNEKPEPEFRAVLGPMSPKGLNPDEFTMAEMLKDQGYATACIGKWHLGDQETFFPLNHGFDYFYGILTSHNQGTDDCPLVVYEQKKVIQDPVNIPLLTKNITEKTIAFINQKKDEPFFVYLPHPMPHFPVDASSKFKGKSQDGIYGDAVQEIDWSVGQIVKTLKENDLDENTIIIFSSDNGGEGRWGKNKGGLNWPLSGHKGTVWEGGFRVPFIAKWPSMIPGGKTSDALITAMDLLPTIAQITGAVLPEDIIIDGRDISDVLFDPDHAPEPNEVFFYYDRDQLQAVRWKNWKLHLEMPKGRFNAAWEGNLTPFDGPRLYNLNTDITETYNLAEQYPDVVKKINYLADSIRVELGDHQAPGKAIRRAGWVEHPNCFSTGK